MRKFHLYDDCYNLVCTIVDDGSGVEVDDLTGVTERTFTRRHLRSQQPHLHMPERIEKSYWHAGQELLLNGTHYEYDQWGYICREEVYDHSHTSLYTLYKTHNARGDLLSETNALGQTALYTYDTQGRRTSATDFSGRFCTTWVYDARGRVVEERKLGDNGQERVVLMRYDALDRLIEKTDEWGRTTHYRHDFLTHEPIEQLEPSLLTAEGFTVPVCTRAAYDLFGQQTLAVDANGHTTKTHYTYLGKPSEILHPDGSSETYTYTPWGALQSHTDRSGLTIHYQHDVLGREISKTYVGKSGHIGTETRTYNALHLLSETDLEGGQILYEYDPAGRLAVKCAKGRVTRYGYDDLERVVEKTEQP